MKKTILFTSFFLFSIFVFGQEKAYKAEKISPYTAHFLSEFRNSESDTVSQVAFQKRFGIKRQSAEHVFADAFIHLNESASLDAIREFGVEINSIIPNINIITARVPVDKLENVALLPDIKKLELGIPVQKKMDISRLETQVNRVQAGEELPMPYTGKNVVVGIIDGGFDLNHDNFYSSDRSEYRIKRFWNQNARASAGTPPAGYSIGVEYKTPEDIQAVGYDSRSGSHGTHVAGTAAGSDRANKNPYYGVAPEADLVFVSYNRNDDVLTNVSISNAVKYIYDYADSEQKPAVVNISLGMHIGPHDGSSTFDRVCDELQGAGKLLVGSAGNEGGDRLHISKTFSKPDDVLKTFISFEGGNSDYYSLVDLWSEANKSFSVQLVVFDENTRTETAISQPIKSNSNVYEKYSLNHITSGQRDTISVYAMKNYVNNRSNVLIVSSLTRNLPAYQYLGLKITASEGTVHGWADNSFSCFSANSIVGWTDGDGRNSIGEIGGTGKRIIAVGAYTTKTDFESMNGFSYVSGEILNRIAHFSSMGPTTDGRMKPDIAAPGTIIVSSYSNAVAESLGMEIVSKSSNSYYGIMQGTSMAAPHVTGILASWLQAKNDLTPEDVREILKTSSKTDRHTGDIAGQGNNIWGYGKIDAWEGMKKVLSLKEMSPNNEQDACKDIRVYQSAGKMLHIDILANISTLTVRLFDLSGQCIYNNDLDVTDITSTQDVDLSSLAHGIYVLTLDGNNVYCPQKIVLY